MELPTAPIQILLYEGRTWTDAVLRSIADTSESEQSKTLPSAPFVDFERLDAYVQLPSPRESTILIEP